MESNLINMYARSDLFYLPLLVLTVSDIRHRHLHAMLLFANRQPVTQERERIVMVFVHDVVVLESRPLHELHVV